MAYMGYLLDALVVAFGPSPGVVPNRPYARGASYIDRSRLKRSRYSGAELRAIRKNGQARECARRVARGCCQ